MTPVSAKKPLDVWSTRMYFGSSSNRYGSPQAEFEIPYGNLGQNGPYGQVAQLYGAIYGYDERAMAKIIVDQRVNANHTPGAIFKDKPITVDDVLNSPVIAAPLHMLEIVMPVLGARRSWSPTPIWPAAHAIGRCGSRDSASGCPTRHPPTPRIFCTPR